MTTNQLRYQELKQAQARDKETAKHNRATEVQARYELAEQRRSNQANELINAGKLTEQIRHNKTGEALDQTSAIANYSLNTAKFEHQRNVDLISATQEQQRLLQQQYATDLNALVSSSKNVIEVAKLFKK